METRPTSGRVVSASGCGAGGRREKSGPRDHFVKALSVPPRPWLLCAGVLFPRLLRAVPGVLATEERRQQQQLQGLVFVKCVSLKKDPTVLPALDSLFPRGRGMKEGS